MIAINKILSGMVAAIQNPQFPVSSEMASTLGLDLSKATVTTTRNGAVSILNARLSGSVTEIGVVGASTPRKTLDLVFVNPAIPVGPYIDAQLGADQRIEQSKHGAGLTIAFAVKSFDCGITASSPDGVVQTLFCAQRPED